MADRSTIDLVRQSVNIVDVIGSYIPLKKTGSNFKSPCPFHEEKTASFVVSEQKQIFKCFGCGVAGNVFTFVEKYEKINFYEALTKVAAIAGVTIEKEIKKNHKQSKQELLYTVYRLANDFFRGNLKKHGEQAEKYLINRGITKETMEKFQLGYSLNSYRGLLNYLEKNHINSKILAESGLFSKGSRNDLYDQFRDRVMFPIISIKGHTVAFGGRVITKEFTGGKYINSPTTSIYQKGNELYGLYQTRYDASKKDNLLLVEGYTDLLRLYENGYVNAAALLGTALTRDQIILASRYTKNFKLVFDGDKAGRKAALKAAHEILLTGGNASIVELPSGSDPDSYLVENSKDDFDKLLESACSLHEFLAKDEVLGYTESDKVKYIMDVIQGIHDQTEKELYIKKIVHEVGEVFGVSESGLLSKLNRRTKIKKNNSYVDRDNVELDILRFIAYNPKSLNFICSEMDDSYFINEIYRDIYRIFIEHEDIIDDSSMLLSVIENESTRNTVGKIILEEPRNDSIEDLVQQMTVRKHRRDLQQLNSEISICKDEDKFQELIKAKKEIQALLRMISTKSVMKTITIRSN